MKKFTFLILLLVSFLFAKDKEDYSEMSNQELIAIIGYVKDQDKESFLKELNSRIPKMSPFEKAKYEKRLIENVPEEKVEDEK